MTYLMRMFLAVSLLTSERVPSEAELMFASPALAAIGQQAEIFSTSDRVVIISDLKSMQESLLQLRSAPSVSALHMFPLVNSKITKEAMKLNQRYNAHIIIKAKLLSPHHEAWFNHVRKDIDWRWTAWDTLDSALVNDDHPYWCRFWLVRLRKQIGAEAFDRGEMPFPIPEWALEELR